MHIPDGFINVPVSGAAVLVSASAIALALKKSRGSMEQEVAPMAGLTAVFIFAVQMLNFPVAAGTSGHLLGGALAAILVGPWVALLAMTVVISLQAFIFADGGLSAIGLNIFNMGVITVLIGWFTFKFILKFLPKKNSSVVAASAIAAFISVPISALGFVVEYAIGGSGIIDLDKVLGAMLSVHVLIGLGEAAISALTIGAVLATRSDLVYGASRLLPKKDLKIKPVDLR
ncbi:MAG: energy-coupling factor ABC transporter permease [Actinobacteria bacterium]|nr:energy-coupling factor ABC transporter permease [Actinomycetota bacterium]